MTTRSQPADMARPTSGFASRTYRLVAARFPVTATFPAGASDAGRHIHDDATIWLNGENT